MIKSSFEGQAKILENLHLPPYHHELDWQGFSMRSAVMLTTVVFLILYNEICQHRDYLYNSVIQYFLNTQRMMLLHNSREQIQSMH